MADNNKDCFNEEELTDLANQISSDSPFLLDTDAEDDITIKPPLSALDNNEDYNHKHSSLSSHSFTHSYTHPKPRLSIVNSKQMPANDSFNIPLPPIPYKKELEDNGLAICIQSTYTHTHNMYALYSTTHDD